MFKSVKSKVALIYIGLVAVIVLLGVISLWNMIRIRETIDGLIITNYNSIVRLNTMRETLLEMDKAMYAHIFGGAPGMRESISILDDKFTTAYEDELETIIIPAEIQYINEIGYNYRAYAQLCLLLLGYDLSDPEERQTARLAYEQELISRQAPVETAIADLYISNEAALFARQEAAAGSARGSILLLGTIFPAAALGGYWLATLYTKRFFAPLYEITQSIKRIREGHLDSESHVSTEDEFGMLANEFNDMTMRLREFEENAIGSLIKERGKTDSLVKSISEPLIVLDKELSVIEMNDAFRALFSITCDSTGSPLGELVFHDELLDYAARISCPAQSSFQPGETITICAGGDDLFFHLTSTPVLGRNDEPIGAIVLLHNITEMKLLEKARSDFIATISHEFKTPLTGITIGAGLMCNERIGMLNDEQHEIIDTIKEDAQRLGVLVGEVLELSKIESFKAIYEFSNCDIEQIITVSVRQFVVAAERGGVSLLSCCQAGLPPVSADFSKITWVLNNLLSNAIKYTETGDSIMVEAFREDEKVVVSVKDTGMGVPEEFVENIFEKFIPIKEYDIEVRGSGVGLAVSKEIVIAHGGRIWCESRLSEGSRFSFTLQPV